MLHTHTHTFSAELKWNYKVRIGQLAKEENRVGESLDCDKGRALYGPTRWLSSFFFFLHPTSELLERVPKPHLPSVCTTQCDDLSNLTIFMCFSWGSVRRARVPGSQGWSGMSWSLSLRLLDSVLWKAQHLRCCQHTLVSSVSPSGRSVCLQQFLQWEMEQCSNSHHRIQER